MIAANGLENFYRQRTAYSEKPRESDAWATQKFAIYDDRELAASFCETNNDGSVTARLLVGGITCAACTWLIEQSRARLPGVQRALVNLQQSRLDIRFAVEELTLT